MKILKIFFKILKVKYYFLPPQKEKILLFDRTGSINFKKYLESYKYKVMDTRLESLNIYILILSLIKYKFKFSIFYYFVEYIRFSESKLVITFIDNYIDYYKLKKLIPKTKFMSVQNGMRTKFFFEDLKKYKNLEIDYMLTFSDAYSKKFSKAIKGKFITIGSFLSNKIALSKNREKTNFVNYISSGPESLNFIKVYKKKIVSTKKYFYPEKICLTIIKNYCLKNNLKLNILGRSNNVKKMNIEKRFFEEILGDFNFNYVKFKSNNRKYTYNLCDKAMINFCIYSALGLEILSRKAKTFIFNYRENATNYSSLNIFWPLKISKEGMFWTSNKISKNVIKSFNNLDKISKKNWIRYLDKNFSELIKYDNKNVVFSKKVKELLNE